MKLTLLGLPYLNEYNYKEAYIHIQLSDTSVSMEDIISALCEQLCKIKSAYRVSNKMDYPYSSSLLANIVCRADGAELDKMDITNIEKEIGDSILQLNEKAERNETSSLINSSTMFSNQSLSQSSSHSSSSANVNQPHKRGQA